MIKLLEATLDAAGLDKGYEAVGLPPDTLSTHIQGRQPRRAPGLPGGGRRRSEPIKKLLPEGFSPLDSPANEI